jgi:arylsulfatase A-like enzyme
MGVVPPKTYMALSKVQNMNRGIFSLLLSLVYLVPVWAADRPNVLWITSEDMGQHLGCYGDTYATTPNLDRLAARGLRYRIAWSNAPVCAPARTTLISGLYPTSTGAEHMRSLVPMPRGMKMYPQYLREAGYYCTNNSKEDYNLEKPGKVWDESSAKAHYKNRKPGQPFFAVFNFLVSHESQIRSRPHRLIHDPEKARIPAYHPDTPEVRHDWAQYYDKVAEMDALAGEAIRGLSDAGLADDTIVFYYADHGCGMPRNKRTPCNSGLLVPFIIYFPEKWKHLAPPEYVPGGSTDRPISFVDLAPSLLSLLGIKPPQAMQGEPFLGKYATAPRQYLHGFRGRMDERIDLVRSVRDQRFVYVRNYLPHLPAGQHVAYQFETSSTRVWKRLFDEGKLNAAQSLFWKPKMPEELYDLQTDPDEVKNLVSSPLHQEVLARLRAAQREQVGRVRDVDLLPEDEMHRRSRGSTPYDYGHDKAKYPLERILAAAETASSLKTDGVSQLQQLLGDDDSGVRYWAAMGLLMRGPEAVGAAREDLVKHLDDPSPSVRVAAAEALARWGGEAGLKVALPTLIEQAAPDKNGPYVAIQALNAIDALGDRAAGITEAIRKLPQKDPNAPARANTYVPTLIRHILKQEP